MLPLAESHVMSLQSYIPGKSIKETKDEYGVSELIKLASNENPFGPSPKAIKAASEAILKGHLYPISGRFALKEKLCEKFATFDVKPHNLVLGNGANELITLLVRSLIGNGEALLNAWPSFIVYRLAAKATGRQEIAVPLTADFDYDLGHMSEVVKDNNVKMVFIASPNNPTGKYTSINDLTEFAQALPEHVILVVDEAYFDYVDVDDYKTAIPLVLSRPRTVVLRTFSKIFGLAGLRIGYAVCDEQIAQVLHRIRDPFNVNGVAQAAALAALDDVEHIEKSKTSNNEELPRVGAAMKAMGLNITPSVGNFVLMHLADHMMSIDEVSESLIKKGVIIRPLKNYDLLRAARITIGTRRENDLLLGALQETACA